MVILTATTREEGYRNREITAFALARQGIGSLLLESPLRGKRRPTSQPSANLLKFSDFFLLCGAAIEESRALLQWLHDCGHRRLGIAGISKGGYIASIAGLRSEMPLAIVTLVPPHSGVPVFLDGLTGRMCNWVRLQATCGEVSVRDKLRRLFDATGLDAMPAPSSNKTVVVIAAKQDRFVPRSSYDTMRAHWEHAQFRWLGGGHVSSILNRRAFTSAVCEAMERLPGELSR
jgi:acetyl esterase/lipase